MNASPSFDSREPDQVVLLNGAVPAEMTVLQVGDRIVLASEGGRVVMEVVEIPGTFVRARLEGSAPPSLAERLAIPGIEDWWIDARLIHEVVRGGDSPASRHRDHRGSTPLA